MSRTVILLGGDITPTNRLREQVSGHAVIAADNGIRHAAKLGIEDRLAAWVGDFDSSEPSDRERYASVPTHAYAAEKDMTDGELAQVLALENGATELLLVGALGGRSDHAFTHLVAATRASCPVYLTSGYEEAVVLDGTVPDWPVGTTFSILALDDLTGLTIEGAKWPLDAVDVPAGSGWTLSNIVSHPFHMSCRTGRAVAIAQFVASV